MSNYEEWNEFLDNMISSATDKYRQTKEYEYLEKQYEKIDMLLRDNLTVDQKELVEDCIFELGLASERKTELLYRQGIKDCVFVLKQLGALA